MENNIRVSVIIPVYNAEKYLRECLDSVVNQTLREIEIICVDDGSTDNSLAILREYEARDSRVKVLTQENQGAGVARNNGMRYANGEYISFLDSDDFLEGFAYQVLYSKAVGVDADVVIHDADYFLEDDNKYVQVNWIVSKPFLPKKQVFSREDTGETLFQIVAGGPCNKIYRRALLSEYKISFPPMRSLEDVPFVYTALAVAKRITYHDGILAHYRRSNRNNNLVSQIDKYPDRIFESYRILKENLIGQGIYEEVERSFINRSASDFVDQYLYGIIKDEDSVKFFKRYLAKVVSFEFGFRDKPSAYFYKKSLTHQLEKLYEEMSLDVNESCDPAVSIIIPCYNGGKFLRRCVNSILEQSFDSFELILVDDGSTDDTPRIIAAYQEMDTRVKCLSQENRFAGMARNYGMSVAKGEYLLFLDSDDFFEKTLVEKLYNAAEEKKADIAICDGYYFDNKTGKIKAPTVLLQHGNIPRKDPFSYKDIPDTILHISIDCPWNKLFKRAFVLKTGLRFQGTKTANDMFFVDSAMLLASSITTVKDRLIYYRTNVSSSLQANRSKNPLDFYQALICIRERLQVEAHYSKVERAIRSFFVTACRFHLNNARDSEEYALLYSFYKSIAFAEWGIDVNSKTEFAFSIDKLWVKSIIENSAEEYLAKHPELPFLRLPIIISLTSYPTRIKTVHKTIETLLNQTLKADKVILWLASCQFPNGEADLPDELLQYRERGLEIKWCDEDLRPHKKYFYAMQEFPNDIIITADDDLLYREDLVEILYKSYLKFPYAVSATRVHLLELNECGDVQPYGKWQKEYQNLLHIPSMQLFSTSGAGTLYPPHCMYKDLFRLDLIKELCINADDLWLKAMQVLAGTPVVLAAPHTKLQYVPNTQETALWNTNGPLGQNDVQLSKILQYYESIEVPAKELITSRIASDAKWTQLVAARQTNKPQTAKQPAKGISTYQRNEAALIRASWSYRIGRFITWPYRMARGFFRCYREHGWNYTWHRVLVHLRPKKIVHLIQGFFRCYHEHGWRYTWRRVLVKLHLTKY